MRSLYIFVILSFLLISLVSCGTIDKISYEADDDKIDFQFPYPDGDDTTVPDGDFDIDKQDTDFTDSDKELSDSDFEDVEGEGDINDSEDSDIEGEQEKLLPHLNCDLIENNSNGFWQYYLQTSDEILKSVATFSKTYNSESPMYTNDGVSSNSNPPVMSSNVKIDDDTSYSAYILCNMDNRLSESEKSKSDDEDFVIRKEKIESEKMTVKYFTVTVPKIDNASLKQVAVLPVQNGPDDNYVDIILVYIQTLSDSDAFLISSPYRYKLGTDEVLSTTQIFPTSYLRLLDGFDEKTQIKIDYDGSAIWINAGNSLHKFTNLGNYQVSYKIVYNLGKNHQAHILDFDLLKNAQFITTYAYIKYEDGSFESVWSINAIQSPAVATKIYQFKEVKDNYKTAITPDKNYAVLASTETNDTGFYYISLTADTKKFYTSPLTNWGRPAFLSEPLRLLQFLPYSNDNFANVENEFAELPFADIIENGQILEQ